VPNREAAQINREPFILFPSRIGEWRTGAHKPLEPQIEQVLGADDYLSVTMMREDGAPQVEFFMAWYEDQSGGGVHSPEVCLPGAGWEIAQLEQIEATGLGGEPFTLNRAIIQKGVNRMLVYYWYDQRGVRTASMYQAKLQLMIGRLMNGRDDSAIVRLITPVGPDEGIAAAERRLQDSMQAVLKPLPRFVPSE